eukprot:637173-Pelagomonas_calceolata.AAC.3
MQHESESALQMCTLAGKGVSSSAAIEVSTMKAMLGALQIEVRPFVHAIAFVGPLTATPYNA